MDRSFHIQLKDREILFDDIIDLSDEQIELIRAYASTRTFKEWRNLDKSDVKIPLESWQQKAVLAHKDILLESKDEEKILKDELIIFTKHARARVAMRVDHVDPSRPPKPETLLLIVKLLIDSTTVDERAEWKGQKNLVYTLIHHQSGEKFKISVSFEKIEHETLKVITVSNEHIDQLTETLGNRPDIRAELEAFRRKLH